MSFQSNENKAMLWKILIDSKAFHGLEDSQLEKVKQEFEKNISFLQKKDLDLINLNKQMVQRMISFLKDLKKNKHMVYLSGDRKQANIDELNQRTNALREDFENTMSVKAPETIKFSELDSVYQPIKTMDEIISTTLEEREIQDKIVSKSDQKEEAEKWIGNNKQKSTDSLLQEILEKQNEILAILKK